VHAKTLVVFGDALSLRLLFRNPLLDKVLRMEIDESDVVGYLRGQPCLPWAILQFSPAPV